MRKLLTAIVLIVATVAPAFAFQFSPLNTEFAVSGTNASKIYTVVNDTDEPIAVAVSALKRCVDSDGEEYNEEIPGYFSITPSKMIVQPQQSQMVRVQYKGPSTVTSELAFRIRAEQIPYTKGRDVQGQTINFLFVYNTSAYVAPSKTVRSASTTAEYDGNGNIGITITNTGNVHQILSELKITVKDGNDAYELTVDDLGRFNGANLLAGAAFNLSIPVPENFDGSGELEVSADWKKTN